MKQFTASQSLIMLHKFVIHRTENLNAIGSGQAALVDQVKPIFLEEFWANHIEKVINFVIFTVGSSCQTDFQMKFVLL